MDRPSPTSVALPGDGPAAPRDALDAAAQPTPARSNNAINALIHLYRAEVGRMATYRQRLDTTTNWAITSSALVTSFALGNAQIPHAAFLFLLFIDFFFLLVEARRFRAYEAARFRVLLLEHYFYPEVLGQPSPKPWVPALLESLRTPYSYPTVGLIGAIGWRLRRNYLWIYAAVLLTWVAKLELVSGAAPGSNLDLVAPAALGRVPGGVIWGLVIVYYLALASIGLLAKRTYPMGSETARAVLSQEPD